MQFEANARKLADVVSIPHENTAAVTPEDGVYQKFVTNYCGQLQNICLCVKFDFGELA
jgi:hypothetical protein